MPFYVDLQKHQEMLLQKRMAAFAQSPSMCRHYDGESDKDVSGNARLVRQQMMTHQSKLGVNKKTRSLPLEEVYFNLYLLFHVEIYV